MKTNKLIETIANGEIDNIYTDPDWHEVQLRVRLESRATVKKGSFSVCESFQRRYLRESLHGMVFGEMRDVLCEIRTNVMIGNSVRLERALDLLEALLEHIRLPPGPPEGGTPTVGGGL